ncbi:MAG: DEAD/DEAH box helicase [Planctomycetes bacterium]|nr:DEAD/DEAH box helicase [Planctomycetota bacterium]
MRSPKYALRAIHTQQLTKVHQNQPQTQDQEQPEKQNAPEHDGGYSSGVFSTLIPELQKAIAAQGYRTPTPVQEQCIPHILSGRDILGTAQTGTGKTAAFSLPILQKLAQSGVRANKGFPRVLILAPTRELAAQIDESIEAYGYFVQLRHAVIFGGVSQGPQVSAINRGADILTATPGRLLDLIQQRFVSLADVKYFVLDEVDRMLDMGFIPDVRRILGKLPRERQTMFFSATMPPKMMDLARSIVRDPIRVAIEPEKPTVEKINQKLLFVAKRDKEALLLSLLDREKIEKAIVFIQRKHAANRLERHLENAGISVAAIHGNKSQGARTSALVGFSSGKFRVLVATDVASRGLDIDDVSHVINFDLPIEAEVYVHRIGRTARAGADGDAISFCSAEDRDALRDIERLLGTSIPVDRYHEFHCDVAQKSTESIPRDIGIKKFTSASRSRRRKSAARHW